MAFSIPALFRRGKKATDPFGAGDDDDFYDDEQPVERNVGRMVAFGMSGFMALLLVSFIVIAVLNVDETAGPQVGMIPTEISEVVSEDGEVLQTLTPPVQTGDGSDQAQPSTVVALPGLAGPAVPAPISTPIALPPSPANTEVVSDATGGTDRSANRRPWLATDSSDGERLGMDRDEPAPAAQPPSRAASVDDLLRRSRENRPAPTPMALAPITQMPTAQPPAAAVPLGDPAPMAMPSADTPTSMPTDVPTDVQPQQAAPQQTAMVPALADPGLVPGAPQRFAMVGTADVSPASAGGAPRLAEPILPPTDSRAVSAAPPRFTTLPPAEELAMAPDAAARVAIIVEGLGLSRAATEAAIETLPSSVTLAFSPYARDLKDWLDKAKEAGHEVLVELPMESNRFPADDPGPLGLLTSLDQIENVDRLSAILEEAEGTVGIIDITGSRFRESAEHINIVMNNLEARGLFYVQGRPGLRLGDTKVPSATADIVLDERTFRASIDARLDFVERLAKYQGSSVAVASAKPVTFERIALWLDDIGRRGVSVAPVSQVLIQ